MYCVSFTGRSIKKKLSGLPKTRRFSSSMKWNSPEKTRRKFLSKKCPISTASNVIIVKKVERRERAYEKDIILVSDDPFS